MSTLKTPRVYTEDAARRRRRRRDSAEKVFRSIFSRTGRRQRRRARTQRQQRQRHVDAAGVVVRRVLQLLRRARSSTASEAAPLPAAGVRRPQTRPRAPRLESGRARSRNMLLSRPGAATGRPSGAPLSCESGAGRKPPQHHRARRRHRPACVKATAGAHWRKGGEGWEAPDGARRGQR